VHEICNLVFTAPCGVRVRAPDSIALITISAMQCARIVLKLLYVQCF
jgi:hypothetical protein